MGYYSNRQPKERWSGASSNGARLGKWVATVVVSAVVGSGATFAGFAIAGKQVPAQPIFGGGSPTVNVAPVSQQLNVSVNDAVTKVFQELKPDVVAVINYDAVQNPFNATSDLQESDIGSGVYFYNNGSDAFIVTNNHVVQGGSRVKLQLSTGKRVTGTVVGTDPYTDLAVIKVPANDFRGVQPAQFANSSKLQVGEPAIAIGTPGGLTFSETVTSGIISGLHRIMPVETPNSSQILDYQPVIQTDTPINPGNSGGPLLNLAGQVMGINSSKIVETGFQSMGFAIPSNEVKKIASEIIRTGHAVHPALGIEALSVDSIPQEYLPNVPVDYGVYVHSVVSASAKASGLKAGDVIVELDGHLIKNAADLRTQLFALKPGDKVTLVVYDGPKRETLHAVLGEMETPNTTDTISGKSKETSDPFINPTPGT
ncbi:MAG: trypsin-like peptidase domain-containing protein [Alicyclobacillaceae bacterium]|jgi:serine protease Do|uniref:S1C family serine protease n=1 Tax=Alicyclobacillus sp. SP_1 TaxID=2942475 RepID=UPI0021570D16|nr:trypsin-like peptidase domain-containing protein [Alicyclobacillus sp. SP_1]MCY0888050.1 trypsin-like peptidase domain-containing protein [Alicyclobacillaceae bacterium]MCY0895664.1 trypsin-like peptidase domain-containing protein [Alicyclobacillaceae bacterium]